MKKKSKIKRKIKKVGKPKRKVISQHLQSYVNPISIDLSYPSVLFGNLIRKEDPETKSLIFNVYTNYYYNILAKINHLDVPIWQFAEMIKRAVLGKINLGTENKLYSENEKIKLMNFYYELKELPQNLTIIFPALAIGQQVSSVNVESPF